MIQTCSYALEINLGSYQCLCHTQSNVILIWEQCDILNSILIAFLTVNSGTQLCILLEYTEHRCCLTSLSRFSPSILHVPLNFFSKLSLHKFQASRQIISISHLIVLQKDGMIDGMEWEQFIRYSAKDILTQLHPLFPQSGNILLLKVTHLHHSILKASRC